MATWSAGTGSWSISGNTFHKTADDSNWNNSYIISTGQALGSVDQEASCSVVVSATKPYAFFGFQTGTPVTQDTGQNGWTIAFYPDDGAQKVKVRVNSVGTDYNMVYDNTDVFRIQVTPTAVTFQKNGITFHTETTWLPVVSSTYFLQANCYYTDMAMTCEYDPPPPSPSSSGTRLPPPPIVLGGL